MPLPEYLPARPLRLDATRAPTVLPRAHGIGWHGPATSCALIAAYVALEWLGFMHEHDGIPVTPWNPGHGLMLAAIILGGTRYGVVFFVGVLLAELVVLRTSLPPSVILLTSAIIAGTYTVAAVIARPLLRHDHNVLLTRDILVLFGAGLAGATIVSAALCAALLSIRHFDLADISRTAVPLVLGDLIGIVVVAPLLLRARSVGLVEWRSPRMAMEVGLFVAAVVPLLLLATWPSVHQPSIFHLLFLPIVIAAMRHGIDGACAALAMVQLILVALLHFHGVELSRFTEYQLLMLVLTLTGLVVGALVSERRRSEAQAELAGLRLQEMQAEAARAARLNLVSGMASALAHEINQPTTAARALARSVQVMLQAPAPDQARIATNLAAVIEQIDHAGAVVSRMREFLRRGTPHSSTLDLVELLSDALHLARPLTSMRQVGLELEVRGPLQPVWGDRVQLQQVVINLIRNSVDSIAEAGRSDGAIAVGAVAVGDDAEVFVRDNGAGIEPARIEDLFAPLSTTRSEGIGLGLSICKSIVEAHGGKIWLAASAAGRTEFRFSLPAVAKHDSSEAP